MSPRSTGSRAVFVGAEDGFVYELNKGTSFDGEVIEAFIQLPFAHQGDPRLLKRYHSFELEMTAAPGTELGLITAVRRRQRRAALRPSRRR
jgi:hypothetical protein